MKKTAVLILLLLGAALGHAALTWTITSAQFIHDVDQGTFVVNTSTYGAIVAFQFEVTLADTVSLNSCAAQNTLTMVTPRTSFPTTNQVKNALQQSITDSEMRQRLRKCVAEKNNRNVVTTSNVADNVSGVVGATVTPP